MSSSSSLTLTLQEWDQRHAAEMLALTQEWNKRWLERENEWMQGEQEREELRRERESKVKDDYMELFTKHMQQMEQKLDEKHRRELESLSRRLDNLIVQTVDSDPDRAEFTTRLTSKFEIALKRAEQVHAKQRQEIEAEKHQEMVALTAALEQERRLHEKAIEDLQFAYQQQLQLVQKAAEEERKGASRAQTHFEETLRTKYESMVEALKQKAQSEEQYRVQRALEQLESIALSPGFMQPAVESDVQRRAEAVASAKFQSLVGDLRASWQQAEEERVQQLEARLQAHYDTVLQHAQAQVEMALSLNDEADHRWMAGMQERNKKQIEAMNAFEAKCHRLYEGRLMSHEENTREMLADYEEKLMMQSQTSAELKAQTESRLRRMKVACMKWRAEYQEEVDRRCEKTIATLETRYVEEIRGLAEQLAEMREHAAEQKLIMAETKQQGFKSEISANMLANLNTEQKASDLDSQTIAQATMAEVLAKIYKIWEGLDIDINARVSTLQHLLGVASYSHKLHEQIDHVREKYESQVPIIKTIHDREIILQKLKSIMQQQRSANQDPNQDPGGAQDDTTRNHLLLELKKVSTELVETLHEYEKKNSPEKFMYNGIWYVQAVERHLSSMPELAFAKKVAPRTDTARLIASKTEAASIADPIRKGRPEFRTYGS